MRGSILGAGVRLDLDDAGLTPARAVLADQASTEQDAGDLRGGVAEEGPVQDAQAGLPG